MKFLIKPSKSNALSFKALIFGLLGFDRGYSTSYNVSCDDQSINYVATINKHLSSSTCTLKDSNDNLLFEIKEIFDPVDRAYTINIDGSTIRIVKKENKEEYNVLRNGLQLMTLNPQSKWDVVAFSQNEQLGQSVNARNFKFIHTDSFYLTFGYKYDKHIMLAIFLTWALIVEEMKTVSHESGWDIITDLLPMFNKVSKKGDLKWDPDKQNTR